MSVTFEVERAFLVLTGQPVEVRVSGYVPSPAPRSPGLSGHYLRRVGSVTCSGTRSGRSVVATFSRATVITQVVVRSVALSGVGGSPTLKVGVAAEGYDDLVASQDVVFSEENECVDVSPAVPRCYSVGDVVEVDVSSPATGLLMFAVDLIGYTAF